MADITLYKFRPLRNDEDLRRAADILESGKFWCSTFATLNDPMEGVFRSSSSESDGIYSEKIKYRICALSGVEAFSDPAMWGYYAGGFLGFAIEVAVDQEKVRPIEYVVDIPTLRGVITPSDIEKILTLKLRPWQHECEYRVLKQTEDEFISIGQITRAYFGDPYGDVDNLQDLLSGSPHLKDYRSRRTELCEIAQRRNCQCFSVKIEGCKVVQNGPLLP